MKKLLIILLLINFLHCPPTVLAGEATGKDTIKLTTILLPDKSIMVLGVPTPAHNGSWVVRLSDGTSFTFCGFPWFTIEVTRDELKNIQKQQEEKEKTKEF